MQPLAIERLKPAVTTEGWGRLIRSLELARPLLAGRSIWLVNSTAAGGGVADMLRSLLPYALGTGFDAHWIVIGGSPRFFAVTKELHNQLHGHRRSLLGADAEQTYESTLAEAAAKLAARVRPGDVVILHDPQTAALAEPLRNAGAIVIWRSHIGTDSFTPVVEHAWSFLLPYVSKADAFVFSRARFVPPDLKDAQLHLIAPSIDPTATKNLWLPMATVAAILEYAGLVQLNGESWQHPRFPRRGASEDIIRRRAEVVRYGPAPRLGVDPIVLHLARWDRLKDPIGVLRGFEKFVLTDLDAHLVIAGPSHGSIADDPEAGEAFEEVVEAWRDLPPLARSRIELAVLPYEDLDENAAIVNALHRASAVVVKKSLEEGFGLGVTEAMWKRRAVVASRVGGIQEQIDHGRSGLLIDDPHDLEAFGSAVKGLLLDRATARRLGTCARSRVRTSFLHDRHLSAWLDLLSAVVRERGGTAGTPPATTGHVGRKRFAHVA